MAEKPYVSIVTSILLSPLNYGKKITGFKKEYPPLPWYTRSEMEEVMREEQTITDSVPEEEDPVLKTLREKDLRMKRNLSKYLTDDSREESSAKRACKEPAVESRSSLSSEEMMTPTSPPSPVVVPSPPVEQTRNRSGCFRLEIEPIDASSYQLDPISQNVSPLLTTEHTPPTSLKEKSSADSQNKVVKDDVTVNQLKTRIPPTMTPSLALPIKDTPELTEEEAADISRKGFILRYESMCRVLGVSGQDSDRILKEWQEEETGTKAKPPGILKNPKERFDTKSDGILSPAVTTPTSEKMVSFCIPQISVSVSHSLPALTPITTVSNPGEEEPITPTLTAVSSIPILPSALMSTPLPAAPPNRGIIPPLTSQDISIITPVPIPTQSIPLVPSSNTLTAAPATSAVTAASFSSSNHLFNPVGFLSQPQSSQTPPVPTSQLIPLLPSVQTKPLTTATILSSSNNLFNPVGFLSQPQSSQTPPVPTSQLIPLLPSVQTKPLTTATSLSSSNNLFNPLGFLSQPQSSQTPPVPTSQLNPLFSSVQTKPLTTATSLSSSNNLFNPLGFLSQPQSSQTPPVPTSQLNPLFSSVQTKPLTTATSLSSSNNLFNPLGFLSQPQSSQTPPVPTSQLNPLFSSVQTKPLTTATSLSSSNNLFNPLGFLSQPQSSQTPPVPTSQLNPFFSVPPSSQSFSNLLKRPSNQLAPAPVSTPSLFQTPLTTKLTPVQTAPSLQLKSNKPFHNLELSYSIPTATKPLMNPLVPSLPSISSATSFNPSLPSISSATSFNPSLPSISSATSFNPSLPSTSSATSFNPSLANNSPFMPLAKSMHSSFLPQGPILSSTPALTNPISTPSFQLNSQPPALPQPPVPTFTPGIPLNFNFGQSTDTAASNIFLGMTAATGGGSRSSGYSSSRGASRGPYRREKKKK